jgi:hypothetical protein
VWSWMLNLVNVREIVRDRQTDVMVLPQCALALHKHPLLRYCLGIRIGIAESAALPFLHIVQKWFVLHLTVFAFYLSTVLYLSIDRDTDVIVSSFHSFRFCLLLASPALNSKQNEVY